MYQVAIYTATKCCYEASQDANEIIYTTYNVAFTANYNGNYMHRCQQ